jgi:DNA-binding transcriptional MerR regulator
LRFWESRFAQIKPMKRGGGRRYYRPEDVELLRGIRFLLYGKGYTIRGVQRILREQGVRFVQLVWREGAHQLEMGPVVAESADAQAHQVSSSGMLGLLSTFRDRADEQQDDEQDDADRESEHALARDGPALNSLRLSSDPSPAFKPRIVSRSAASGSLTPDELHRLHTALKDLNECRRILNAALKRDDA